MAKLRPDLQHKEGEEAAVDPALATAVQEGLDNIEEARRKIKEMFGAPEGSDGKERGEALADTGAPAGGGEDDAPSLPGPETIPDGGVAAAGGAVAASNAPIDPLKRQIVTDLVALAWGHSDAVWVANRTLALMAEHSISWEYAKDNAIYEFHRKDAPFDPPVVPAEKTRGARPPMEKVYGPKTDAEANEMIAAGYHAAKVAELDQAQQAKMDAVQAVQQDASQLTVGDPNELVQIIHNLQRDVARLAKLLGLEGVRKTRKRKDGD